MYKLNLDTAYCPAQADTDYHERTIEQMLRAQADQRPDALAMRELIEDIDESCYSLRDLTSSAQHNCFFCKPPSCLTPQEKTDSNPNVNYSANAPDNEKKNPKDNNNDRAINQNPNQD